MKQEQEKRKPKYDRTQGFPKRLFDLLGGENADRGEYAKLAREIGVSTAAISNYISGLTGVSADNLIAIAKYFNVSTDYLLGLDDIPIRTMESTENIAAYTGLSAESIMRLHEASLSVSNELIASLVERFIKTATDEFTNSGYVLVDLAMREKSRRGK